MANPNNLLRPPVLNNPSPPSPSPPQPSGSAQQNLTLNDINAIVRMCQEQSLIAVRQVLNPYEHISGTDQGIDERYRENLSDLDKIPDVVRCLREFSGNQSEYSSWKKSVERVLKIYESSKGTPKYFGILNVIRNKIIGSADAALESYNTPLNWECISRCLTLHYADKRDLSTLEYQMISLVQGNCTIQEFYQVVYSQLSLIMNKLSSMEISNESLDLLTQTYRDKALDTFIRGLKGDLPRLLGIREPTDLPQALHLCLKLENQQYRARYANSHAKNEKPQNHPLPRKNFNQNNTPFYPNQGLVPQFSQNSVASVQQPQFPNQMPQWYANQMTQQQFAQHQFGQNGKFAPQRPMEPKPQSRPEPMDIDQSMRSKIVNYMNRPVQDDKFAGKRPPNQSNQVHQPFKMQRNFHLEATGAENNANDEHYTSEMQNYEDEQQLQPLNDYINEYGNCDQEDEQNGTQEFIDIHFLD